MWTVTKHREEIQQFRKTDNLNHLNRTGLDKACFAQSACYNRKDLAKRTTLDKILKERAYEIAIYPKYDGYQRGLASMVYTLFDKKAGVGTSVIEELFLKLYKPMIKKRSF